MARNFPAPQRLFTLDFAIAFATTLLIYMVGFLAIPVMPLYVLHLGGRESDIGWITAAYTTAMLLLRPLSGKWSERFGPAQVMRAASAMILVSVLAYNFSGVIWLLVLTRLVHGAGHGVYTTSSSSLVAYMAPPERRAQALGVFLVVISVAMGLGPAIGMALVNAFSFSSVFIVMAGVTCISFILNQLAKSLKQYGPKEPTEGKLFCKQALLPSFVGVMAYFTYGALTSYLPIHALQHGLDNPGFFFAAYAVMAGLIRIFGGRLSDRVGRVPIVVTTALIMAVSTLWLALANDPISIIAAGAVYGFGSGILYPALMALSVDLAAPQERSSAVATFLASQDLGQILGAMISGIVVAQFSLQAVWIVAGSIALLAPIVFVKKPRSGRMLGQAN